MISIIKAMFSKDAKPKTDFSDFFYNASSGEKKKLMLEVIREATDDQRQLIKKYERLGKART